MNKLILSAASMAVILAAGAAEAKSARKHICWTEVSGWTQVLRCDGRDQLATTHNPTYAPPSTVPIPAALGRDESRDGGGGGGGDGGGGGGGR